jgi:hypothetical protein
MKSSGVIEAAVVSIAGPGVFAPVSMIEKLVPWFEALYAAAN